MTLSIALVNIPRKDSLPLQHTTPKKADLLHNLSPKPLELLATRRYNYDLYMRNTDEKYMKLAVEQALLSKAGGDVPFGACIVKDGEVVAVGENSEMRGQNITCHAEINAITAASAKLGRDLSGCTIYSTVEPCTMCTGAILYACLSRVVYGARREDMPHLFRVRSIRFQHLAQDYGHSPEVIYGVLKDECVAAFDDHKRSWRVNAALIVSRKPTTPTIDTLLQDAEFTKRKRGDVLASASSRR